MGGRGRSLGLWHDDLVSWVLKVDLSDVGFVEDVYGFFGVVEVGDYLVVRDEPSADWSDFHEFVPLLALGEIKEEPWVSGLLYLPF